jgi:hypothetical protein
MNRREEYDDTFSLLFPLLMFAILALMYIGNGIIEGHREGMCQMVNAQYLYLDGKALCINKDKIEIVKEL